MFVEYMDTILGKLEICASDSGVTRVIFCEMEERMVNRNEIVVLCKQQLTEYFEGERQEFELPIEQSGTEFQETVWRYLLKISFGETASYGDVAKGISRPKAVRAVGAANGRNLISIIVPCHRVIGSNGALTGYAGGVSRKTWLLNHEGAKFRV